MDVKHVLAANPLRPAYVEAPVPTVADPADGWISPP